MVFLRLGQDIPALLGGPPEGVRAGLCVAGTGIRAGTVVVRHDVLFIGLQDFVKTYKGLLFSAKRDKDAPLVVQGVDITRLKAKDALEVIKGSLESSKPLPIMPDCPTMPR